MSKLTTYQVIDIFLEPKKAHSLTMSNWSQLIFVLRECDLLARFYHLSNIDNILEKLPDRVQHHLNSANIKAERQAKQAKFEAAELAKNLKSIDVNPIFLKGVAYTLLNSVASMGRIYSDMDVLVDKKQLHAIERKLSLYGWFSQKNDDYDQKYYREWAHEIPPLQHGARGTVADIHHNLLPPISGRAPDIELFTSSLYTTQSNLKTLSKPAMVLHSIIHLFFNEEFSHGFRDLTDLHLLFSEEESNSDFWAQILVLSEQSKFTTELFYAVRYCQKITKTKFPIKFIDNVKQFQICKIKLRFADFIFCRVLLPSHPSLKIKYSGAASTLALVRAHLLKMPLHILVHHSIHKFYTSLFKNKEDQNTVQNAVDKRN